MTYYRVYNQIISNLYEKKNYILLYFDYSKAILTGVLKIGQTINRYNWKFKKISLFLIQ